MGKKLFSPLEQSRACIRAVDKLKEHPDTLANCAFNVGQYIGADCISYSVALRHIVESVSVFNDSLDMPMFKAIILQNIKAGIQNPATENMVMEMEEEDENRLDDQAD